MVGSCPLTIAFAQVSGAAARPLPWSVAQEFGTIGGWQLAPFTALVMVGTDGNVTLRTRFCAPVAIYRTLPVLSTAIPGLSNMYALVAGTLSSFEKPSPAMVRKVPLLSTFATRPPWPM